MSQSPPQLGVGLFGLNGHQVHDKLRRHPYARVVAVGDVVRDQWPHWIARDQSVKDLSLDSMIEQSTVDLVVLCSSRRAEQAEQAVRCLEAGKHVYAEKPCAFSEADLDQILQAARDNSRIFREMNDTMFTAPFHHMRGMVSNGAVGRVVQVFAQKSYPLAGKNRPTDDDTDGGLLRQVGVHAVRMVEHIAGQRISDAKHALHANESSTENPQGQPIIAACTMNLRLVGGATATCICNYLNPLAYPCWGNEALHIYGTKGMIECVDGGARSRWVTHEQDHGPWHVNVPPPGDPFDELLREIRGEPNSLLAIEEDLHPTRVVIRAFNASRNGA